MQTTRTEVRSPISLGTSIALVMPPNCLPKNGAGAKSQHFEENKNHVPRFVLLLVKYCTSAVGCEEAMRLNSSIAIKC